MFFVHFLYDLIFMQNLYPHLTAIQRTKLSFPSRILHERKLLKGQVLDFGCGFGKDTELLQQQGVNIQGYDPYYQPIYPQQKFDTVLSNYVLNVLDKVSQTQVLIQISNLLQPQGIAEGVLRDGELYLVAPLWMVRSGAERGDEVVAPDAPQRGPC